MARTQRRRTMKRQRQRQATRQRGRQRGRSMRGGDATVGYRTSSGNYSNIRDAYASLV